MGMEYLLALQNIRESMGAVGNTFFNLVWKTVLFSLVFLIAFSRNVLGVHTFLDVLVGLIIGIVFLILIDKIMIWIEKEKNKRSFWYCWYYCGYNS